MMKPCNDTLTPGEVSQLASLLVNDSGPDGKSPPEECLPLPSELSELMY